MAPEPNNADLEKASHSGDSSDVNSVKKEEKEFDFDEYQHRMAGRLVVTPEEAAVEFGAEVASKLKLNKKGTKVLWPQPTDDPEDPQNWSRGKKTLMLIIVTMAAFVPDFDSGIGIAVLFPISKQFNTTPGVINDVTSNWSIFLLGPGGIFAVMLVRRYGRLPILFWSQVIALGFLIGCTFAPNFNTFAAMRCLTAFFGTAPQITGLYVVTDMYPFHLQARKINIWTTGFILSPIISPFAFGFLVARANWRWAYGIGCLYGLVVVLAIIFLLEETAYERHLKPVPKPTKSGSRIYRRFAELVGITGVKMSKYRCSWREAIFLPFNILWRPQGLTILFYEAVIFGFSVGMHVTNVVFLGEPKPFGYGLGQFAIAGVYGTPIVAVLLGEFLGRYLNDGVANWRIRKNHGVFEPEMRLWALYAVLPFYVAGFVLLGGAYKEKLSLVAVVFGWLMAQCANLMNTVSVYAYMNNAFPRHPGEVSGLVNMARTLGGFAVAYYQVPWAEKNGALQTFGTEAGVVAACFILIIPLLQIKGASWRAKYSL